MSTHSTAYDIDIKVGDIIMDINGKNYGSIIRITPTKFETEESIISRNNEDNYYKVINRDNVIIRLGSLDEIENELLYNAEEFNQTMSYVDENTGLTENYIYIVYPLIPRNLKPTGRYIEEMVVIATYPDEAKTLAGSEENIGCYKKYWTDKRFLICKIIGRSYVNPCVVSSSYSN
jgi:hypothetical protein